MALHAAGLHLLEWLPLLQYQRLAALLLTTLPYRGRTRDIKLLTQPLALG